MSKRIAVVFGTRPDAIKMAPLILEQPNFPDLELIPVSSGQHKEMLQPVLDLFGITPAYDAGVMQAGQSLDNLTAKIVTGLGAIFDELKPDTVLVHGDTTTGFGAALAAFYRKIPSGHVEAGLRTPDLFNPFPEEMNRRVIDQVCRYHFAPTEWASHNLAKEGFTDQIITGNTVVDALQWMRNQHPALPAELASLPESSKLILLTTHRRENIGGGMSSIFQAVREIIAANPDVHVLFPIHLNTEVRDIALRELQGLERIHVIEPIGYGELVAILERCYLVLTDSGGLQEEAPAFHKPVLVLRETTERPEILEAGCGVLLGTDRDKIIATTQDLLHNPDAYRNMAESPNPYGQPGAAARILQHLQ